MGRDEKKNKINCLKWKERKKERKKEKKTKRTRKKVIALNNKN